MDKSSCLEERQPLLHTQKGNKKVKKQCFKSRLCLRSKSAILIILWTLFTGAAYTTLMTVATPVIVNNYHYMNADSEVTYPILAILYAGMAVVATLYPVIGFIADVSCGRFKVVIGCFSLIILSYLTAYICLVADLVLIISTDLERRAPPPIIVIASIAILLIFIGFAGYQANFIQLGLDQLMSAPSQDLALFVHWATWAFAFGSSILACYWLSSLSMQRCW